MLLITDHTSGKTRKYATTDAELVDSLFNEGEGTLNPLHKIEKRPQAVLFWTDEESGVYLWKKSGLWGKFRKVSNGRVFYQYTLDSIELTQEA
jgi:hypothetical protein